MSFEVRQNGQLIHGSIVTDVAVLLEVWVCFAPLTRRRSEQRDVEQVGFVCVSEPLGLFGEIALR